MPFYGAFFQISLEESKLTSERTVIAAGPNGACPASAELLEENMDGKNCLTVTQPDQQDRGFTVIRPEGILTSPPLPQSSPGPEKTQVANLPSQTSSAVSLAESVQSIIPGSTGMSFFHLIQIITWQAWF